MATTGTSTEARTDHLRRRLPAALLAAALALGMLLAPTAPASADEAAPAAEEVPSPSGITLWPNRVPQGGTVTVTGAGFAAGAAVTVVLDGGVVASTFTDDDGFFQVTFAADAPPGDHIVTVTVGGIVHELSLTITAPTGTYRDSTASVHQGAIERLAAAGVTAGCAPDLYCPGAPVTRAQMATFLDRTVQLPPAEGVSFADVEGSVHREAIERLASAGITAGCAPELFCPTEPVTRAQMATFLDRAFAFPPLASRTSVSTDLDGGGKGDKESASEAPDIAPGQVVEVIEGGQLDGVQIGTRGGAHIHGVCDVDGDGESEIVLEDPLSNPGPVIANDLVSDPDTDVDIVWVGTYRNGSIVALTDLDGDGDCDIVVLDPVTSAGSKITAKADGDADQDVIWVGAHGGVTFVGVSDLDADGEGEVQLRDPSLPQGQAVDVHFDPTQADGSGDGDVDIRYLP